MLSDDPKCAKFKQDIVDPNRERPYTDNTDPTRMKCRREIQLPSVTKSSTEREDPKRPRP
jgi:hypothetical protein